MRTLLRELLCRIRGHRFVGDAALGERGIRVCGRCGMVRGAPRQPVSARATARALEKIAAAAGHDARGERVGGNERFKHRVLAEAEREAARRIMRAGIED